MVEFHRACQRLCWVNFESVPCCQVAVLGGSDHLPQRVARTLYENQIDFHYLEDRHLWEDAKVTEESISIGPMRYDALVAEEAFMNREAADALGEFKGRALVLECETDFLARLRQLVEPTVQVTAPCPWLRARLVEKQEVRWLMLFNEGVDPIAPNVRFPGEPAWFEVSPATATVLDDSTTTANRKVALQSGELRLFMQPG